MFHSPLKRWNLALSCVFLSGAILFGLSAYQGSTFIVLSALGLLLCIGSIILPLVRRPAVRLGQRLNHKRKGWSAERSSLLIFLLTSACSSSPPSCSTGRTARS